MMCQLDEAVRSVETWEDGRVLLLSGEGGHFCSGADLSTVRLAIDTPERGALMSQLMTDTLNRMRNLPLLSIAAIDGAAVGGGAELCTATDLRVVSLNATIQFVHTRLGAAPGWGGAARLAQDVGRSSALKLLLLAEKLDADAIMRLGLAHACGHEGESATDVAMRTIVTPSLEVRISRLRRLCHATAPLGARPIPARTDLSFSHVRRAGLRVGPIHASNQRPAGR
jgi:ethylmalonyl-CoA/methylmalonyl-CoA decarboxylase